MLDVGIQVGLDATKALVDAEELTERLNRASIAAASIKMPASAAASNSQTAQTADQAANSTLRLAQALAREEQAAGNSQTAIRILQQAIQQYNSQVASVTIQRVNAQTQLNTLTNQSNAAMTQQNAVMGALIGRAVAFAAAYISVQEAFRLVGDMVKAREEMDRLDIGMKAIAPDAATAASAQDFLIKKTNELGLSVTDTIPEFVKMAAAFTQSGFSFKQTEQVFTDVSTAVKAIGLSSATVGRILYDFQEMASLGTVQMRQMRQVMMQIPGGMDIAARSIGVTTEKLHEMIRAGTIDPTTFIPAFTHELATTFGSDLPEATDTLESHVNRLKNSWTLMLAEMGRNPGIKWMVDAAAATAQAATPNTVNQDRIETERRNLVFHSGAFGTAYNPQLNMVNDLNPFEQLGEKLYPQSFISDDEVTQQLNLQDRLGAQKKRRVPGTITSGAPTWDTTDETDDVNREKAAQKFWELYDKLRADSLTGEAKQRQEIIDKYDEEITRLPAATAGRDFLVSQLQAGKSSALNDLSSKNALDRYKSTNTQFTQANDISERAAIDLMPDEQARRVAEVNKSFDDIYKKILLIDLANPTFIKPQAYDDIEAARQRALSDIKPTKTPLPFVGESLGDLQSQKSDLQSGLAGSSTVEEYNSNSQKIQEISQAMHLKLEADDTSYFDAFQYGMRQVSETWQNTSETMAAIGQTLSQSLDKSMTGALTSIADGTKTPAKAFTQMAMSIVSDIEKVIIETTIVQPLIKAIGLGGTGLGNSGAGGLTALPGLIGGVASLFGSGAGLAGGGGANPNAQGVTGSDSYFHLGGIIRAHSGDVIGDEVPIVARKGEGIFTPEQMKAMGGVLGGKGGANVSIMNVSDPHMVEQHIASNPDIIVNAIGQRASTIRRMLS